MIYSDLKWVHKAIKDGKDCFKQRMKTKKCKSIYYLKHFIAKRKGLDALCRYTNFYKIEKYNNKYDNALYFLYRLINCKKITVYNYIKLHTFISLYYEIQGSSERPYNHDIQLLLRNKFINKKYKCKFVKTKYYGIRLKCKKAEKQLRFYNIIKNREEKKEELNFMYDYQSCLSTTKVSMLNTCSRCNKVSSKKWVHGVYWRKPESMGSIRARASKEYWEYLCTGCRNKFRPLEKAQREADEIRYLINKLKRTKNENIKKCR